MRIAAPGICVSKVLCRRGIDPVADFPFQSFPVFLFSRLGEKVRVLLKFP